MENAVQLSKLDEHTVVPTSALKSVLCIDSETGSFFPGKKAADLQIEKETVNHNDDVL